MLKVDGDERRDLVERYAVKAYPTGLLLSADATESSRFVGYQTVKQIASFLTLLADLRRVYLGGIETSG